MTRRWIEQRRPLDNTIRAVGVDWDQPRTISYNAHKRDCYQHYATLADHRVEAARAVGTPYQAAQA